MKIPLYALLALPFALMVTSLQQANPLKFVFKHEEDEMSDKIEQDMLRRYKNNKTSYSGFLIPQIYPTEYTVHINPNFLPIGRPETFQGSVYVDIQVAEPDVKLVAMHCDRLVIVMLNVKETETDTEVAQSYRVTIGTLWIAFLEPLSIGKKYTVFMKYTGHIDGLESRGLYTKFLNSTLVSGYMTIGRFERTFARRVFPCFDEPYFRSRFIIRLEVPPDYMALSNMDENRREIRGMSAFQNRSTTIEFKPTNPIATYEIAMFMGMYEKIASEYYFEMYYRKELCGSHIYEKDLINELTQAYAREFSMGLTAMLFRKLKIILIPEMKNILHQSRGVLLMNDQVMCRYKFERDVMDNLEIILAISRALSRVWIGYGVILDWWANYWLHEGFAEFYSYFIKPRLFPEYSMERHFILDVVQPALLEGEVHPMQLYETNIQQTVEEIDKKNNKATYQKSASILRMLRYSMSRRAFSDMVRAYIQENAHRTVSPSTIIDYLNTYWPNPPYPNFPSEYFNQYTKQIGYPIVSVHMAADRMSVDMTQRRHYHFHDGTDTYLLYTVPITYTSNLENNFHNTTPVHYLTPKKTSIQISFPKPIEWVIVNVQQSGFYRVVYDKPIYNNLWHALRKPNHSGIHEINRAQLIDDLFSYGKISIYNYDFIFTFLEYLRNERAYLPWKTFIKGIDYISLFLTEIEYQQFAKFVMFVTKNAFREHGLWEKENDTYDDINARNALIVLRCKYGGAVCLRNTTALMHTFIYSHGHIPVNSRYAILCGAMMQADELQYEVLDLKRRLHSDMSEKRRIFAALCCAQRKEVYNKTFNDIWLEAMPMEQKFDLMCALMRTSHNSAEEIFKIFAKQMQKSIDKFGDWKGVVTLMKRMSYYLTTEKQLRIYKQLAEVVYFLYRYDPLIAQGIDQIEFNIQWREGYMPQMRQYLKKKPWRNDGF